METILETKNLCKYFGGVKAVNQISIKMEKDVILGLIGPNGAGKTTFFNLLTGMFKPTAGDIILKGENITNIPPYKITNLGISRTFQNINLFEHLSVLDNVKIGFHSNTNTGFVDAILRNKTFKKDEYKVNKLGKELLARVGLKGEEEISAQNLSYGKKRKLEIARALATNPEILLLDEPTAGMNPVETAGIVDLIRSLYEEGIFVIVIEHDMKLIMSLCDKIIVFNEGRVICQGSPEYIKKDPVVIEAYLGKE